MSEKQSVADSPEEMLVQDGCSTRYINEVLLSRVLEEVGLLVILRSGYLTVELGTGASVGHGKSKS